MQNQDAQAWFILSKRQTLMEDPTVTQRWLDFLGQYGLKTKQITSFLLQAPPTFLKVRAAAARGQKEHSRSLSRHRDKSQPSHLPMPAAAPHPQQQDCTLVQAGSVVAFLKSSLGLRDEFIAPRIVAVFPAVLMRPPEELRATVAFLMTLVRRPPSFPRHRRLCSRALSLAASWLTK